MSLYLNPKRNPKPSEIAAETRRHFIPLIKGCYASQFPPFSTLYNRPIEELMFTRQTNSTRAPVINVEIGDPVTYAMCVGIQASRENEAMGGSRVRFPFVCSANENRPGGFWETCAAGYEEQLCRRSNLSATLVTPWPEASRRSHYPMPPLSAILANSVVVHRGPHGRYEQWTKWSDLPVISVSPTKAPKLSFNGQRYSFSEERSLMRDKMRGALYVCLINGYDRVVVGDFGLGPQHRNPPWEIAKIWRDIVLFDPMIRGQLASITFVFVDPTQSTSQIILQEGRKAQGLCNNSAPQRVKGIDEAIKAPVNANPPSLTDFEIFQEVFKSHEIKQLVEQRDPRCDIGYVVS